MSVSACVSVCVCPCKRMYACIYIGFVCVYSVCINRHTCIYTYIYTHHIWVFTLTPFCSSCSAAESSSFLLGELPEMSYMEISSQAYMRTYILYVGMLSNALSFHPSASQNHVIFLWESSQARPTRRRVPSIHAHIHILFGWGGAQAV